MPNHTAQLTALSIDPLPRQVQLHGSFDATGVSMGNRQHDKQHALLLQRPHGCPECLIHRFGPIGGGFWVQSINNLSIVDVGRQYSTAA